jgi:hypothetical protein
MVVTAVQGVLVVSAEAAAQRRMGSSVREATAGPVARAAPPERQETAALAATATQTRSMVEPAARAGTQVQSAAAASAVAPVAPAEWPALTALTGSR